MAKVEFLAIIPDRSTSITLGGLSPAVRFVADEKERCNIAALSEVQGVLLKVTVEEYVAGDQVIEDEGA